MSCQEVNKYKKQKIMKTKIPNFNKSLSHFNISRVYYEPLRLSLFEVDIVTKRLTPHEKTLFKEQIVAINQSVIKFNINIVDKKIQPLEIISKLIDENFDICVKLHDKEGNILGEITYNDVSIDENCPIFGMNTDFSYESTDCSLTFDLWIKSGDVYFKGYNNKIKLYESLK